jgi:hypothetical protein
LISSVSEKNAFAGTDQFVATCDVSISVVLLWVFAVYTKHIVVPVLNMKFGAVVFCICETCEVTGTHCEHVLCRIAIC